MPRAMASASEYRTAPSRRAPLGGRLRRGGSRAPQVLLARVAAAPPPALLGGRRRRTGDLPGAGQSARRLGSRGPRWLDRRRPAVRRRRARRPAVPVDDPAAARRAHAGPPDQVRAGQRVHGRQPAAGHDGDLPGHRRRSALGRAVPARLRHLRRPRRRAGPPVRRGQPVRRADGLAGRHVLVRRRHAGGRVRLAAPVRAPGRAGRAGLCPGRGVRGDPAGPVQRVAEGRPLLLRRADDDGRRRAGARQR